MHKRKTHKGLKKRLTVTAGNKLVYKRSRGAHRLSNKSGNDIRRYGQPNVIQVRNAERYLLKLGYGKPRPPRPESPAAE
jgi:ribosomal protein L35